ncbi:SDR family oxidoreductase [Anaerolineae bacterium CFX9]|nr:SDR family oxidoreductase [Anaerolineae bacterium CFX9]
MGTFDGKIVVVTGATGNLGSAVSRKFAAEGAKLVLVDRSMDKLQALAEKLNCPCLIATGDLSVPEDVAAIIASIETDEEFGHIDVLAHTVGGYEAGTPVNETSLDVLERQFNLNVKPVFVTGGHVASHMLKHKVEGKIIFVLARSALKGSNNHGAYTASKAAAQRIMESMSAELRDHGINVNGVMPSTIDTPANREAMPKADTSKWVTPEQLADAIAFLASDNARALHGVSLEVYNRA